MGRILGEGAQNLVHLAWLPLSLGATPLARSSVLWAGFWSFPTKILCHMQDIYVVYNLLGLVQNKNTGPLVQ